MIVDSTNPRIMADNIRELARNGGGGSDLPEVDVSDVGKVLTVGDTGEWEADDLPPQLPEVDVSDAGKVLTVSDTGEWEVDEIASGGYSTVTNTSVNTGNNIFGFDEKIWVGNPPSEFGVISGVVVHGIRSVSAMLNNTYTDLSGKIKHNGSASYPGDVFAWEDGQYISGLTNMIIVYY